MAKRLHLHANFPYLIEVPNAALGYLKSALSEEKVNVTNIYWYLPPREILESISALLIKFQNKRIDLLDPPALFTAYLSRFFHADKATYSFGPTLIEHLLTTYNPLKKVNQVAKTFKDFVDHSIENENMADVDIAGFTVNFYQWIISSYIWSKLKELNPNIKVVVGGLATRSEAQTFMKTFQTVDYAVWGEGEIPLKELVRRIDDRKSLPEVPHLVYRDKNGLRSTDVPVCRVDPPFADHSDYFKRVKEFDIAIPPFIPIWGTRSCRWNKCKFCSVNRGIEYYERPVKDVVREIEYQSEKYNVDKFMFVDTDIGRKNVADFENLLRELLRSVNRRKKPYDIWAEVSPAFLNGKYMEMMSKIRMVIQIGFEALTDSLLQKMRKMHRFAENIQALKLGRDYGVNITGLNVLRNLPEECEKDIIESMENLNYLRFFLNRYILRPSELTLYKGTAYYNETPLDEREKWVTNIMYDETKQTGLIKEDNRWDFFGFRAHQLKHHLLWDQFSDMLERFQKAKVFYTWLEFSDRSSFIEEYNEVSGHEVYFLDGERTRILKFCDNIRSWEHLRNEFSSSENIEDTISQLRRENLLYVDEERGYLISIPSSKDIRKIHEVD